MRAKYTIQFIAEGADADHKALRLQLAKLKEWYNMATEFRGVVKRAEADLNVLPGITITCGLSHQKDLPVMGVREEA